MGRYILQGEHNCIPFQMEFDDYSDARSQMEEFRAWDSLYYHATYENLYIVDRETGEIV